MMRTLAPASVGHDAGGRPLDATTTLRTAVQPPDHTAALVAPQAQVDALHAQVSALRAERAPVSQAPPGADGPRAEPGTSRRRLLQRRGLLAGGAALLGAGATKLVGPNRVEAGHDNLP